jgi:succinate dehydrogenase/fumarate reductase flavoprotein subunit
MHLSIQLGPDPIPAALPAPLAGPGVGALAEFRGLREEHRELMDCWGGRSLRKMLRVCELTTRGALIREETRGAHIREDFPHESAAFEGHITLKRGTEPRIVKWSS